ncbi:MAG: hypothetical protein R2752_05605 [Vicinamibacterales bacterium]
MWLDLVRWSLVPWVALAVLVTIGLLAVQPDRRRFDIFTPLAFAAWSHVLPVYGLGGLVLVAGWLSPAMHQRPMSDEILVETMAGALLGFGSLALGFAAPWGRQAGAALAGRLPAGQWTARDALVPALLLLAFATVLTAVAFDRGLVGYQAAGRAGPFDAALAIGAMTASTTALALLGLIALSHAPLGLRSVALSAFLMRVVADLLLSGSRGTLLQAAFLLAGCYACSGRSVRWRQVAVLGAAFGVAVTVGMAYGSSFRAVKGNQDVVGLADTAGTVATASREVLDRGVRRNLSFIWTRFVERVEIVSNAAVVVADSDRLAPFEAAYGLDDNISRSLMSALVPRVLWPGKPATSDPRTFGELYFGFRNAFAVTSAADLRRNYGVAGIVVGMAALGVLLRLIYAALIERRETSLWRGAAYVSLLLSVSYEGFFGAIVPMLLRTALVCAVCLVGLEFVRRVTSGRRRPAEPRA